MADRVGGTHIRTEIGNNRRAFRRTNTIAVPPPNGKQTALA